MVRKLASKLNLGVFILEDRLQPNDMFGLGLSLLTGASPTGLADQQPALVSEQPQPIAVVGEATPVITSELPEVEHSQVVQAPTFGTGVIESVFSTVNAQPTQFSLDTPVPVEQAQAPAVTETPHGQYSGGALLANAQDSGGIASHPPVVLTNHASNDGLLLALMTGAKKEESLATRGPTFQTIVAGTVSAHVNSFGFANDFQALGGGNQLFNTGYFMSTGGAPFEITSVGGGACSEIVPLTLLSPDRADSLVSCGAAPTYIYFINQVYDDATFHGWFTGLYVYGSPSCIYAYNDYDVAGFPGDNGSHQDYGTVTDFVVRDGTSAPKYLYGEVSGSGVSAATHWQQAAYPSLITGILGFSGCGNLTDGPAIIGPLDWTGALQYNTPAADPVINILHWRDDSWPYP